MRPTSGSTEGLQIWQIAAPMMHWSPSLAHPARFVPQDSLRLEGWRMGWASGAQCLQIVQGLQSVQGLQIREGLRLVQGREILQILEIV